jgi:hypothetical protein
VYTSTRRWRGLTLSVYWADKAVCINLAVSSLTGPDHGTTHCAYTIAGESPEIPSVEDLIATAQAALGRLEAERGRPAGRPIPARPRWVRRHASGVPSGDHRGGRVRWSEVSGR